MKKPKQIFEQNRAVSPVVGVALLIAIAVVLAAVIGSVVLGIGTSSAEAPQASLSFDEGDTDLTISHDGGQALDDENIVLRGDGVGGDVTVNSELSAGQSWTVDTSNDGGDVSVVWQDPESDDETVIGSTTVGA